MVSSQKFQVLGVVVDVVVGGGVVVVSGGGIVDGPLQSTPAPMKHVLPIEQDSTAVSQVEKKRHS